MLNVTGLMLRELPLGYEKRRQAVLSLSNGAYVSVQMDVVASVDQGLAQRGGLGGVRPSREHYHMWPRWMSDLPKAY